MGQRIGGTLDLEPPAALPTRQGRVPRSLPLVGSSDKGRDDEPAARGTCFHPTPEVRLASSGKEVSLLAVDLYGDEQVLRVFWSAVDRPASDRDRYVAEQCSSSAELEGRVRKLLAAYSDAEEQPSCDSVREFVGWFEREAEPEMPTQIGRYVVLDRLGSGGMGVVYLARDPQTDRRVAIKVLNPGVDAERAAHRFELESALLARLRHPGIAQVYGAGRTPAGLFYMVLEYVDGLTLNRYCREHELSDRSKVELLIRVCDAVQHAHQRGVIHRDLKPANVLLSGPPSDPVVKLIDFGLAKVRDGEATVRPFATVLGHVVGTFAYMSPEQSTPGSEVDLRTDVYSLGLVLAELLTGRLPELERPDSAEHYQNELRTADLDSSLRWILQRAVHPDPAQRYQDCAALGADLNRHLAGEPTESGPPGWRHEWKHFRHRYRRIVWPATAVIATLVICIGVFLGLWLVRSRALGTVEAAWRQERMAADEAAAREREILRLAEYNRIERLQAPLCPALGQEVAEYRGWLAELAALESRLWQHAQTLGELRGRSGALRVESPKDESPEDESAGARAHSSWAERLRRYRAAVADVENGKIQPDDASFREFEEEVAHLEQCVSIAERVERPGRWSFENDIDQWHHDLLQRIVTGATWLLNDARVHDDQVNTRGTIQLRLDRALEIERQFGEAAAQWEAATRSIANPRECPAYDGLAIDPQPGLFPLARDPESGLWEFLLLGSGLPPQRDREGRVVPDADFGVVLVLIPGGIDLVGGQAEDPQRPNFNAKTVPYERPVQEVMLDPYFISKFEVTRGQWWRMTRRDPALEVGAYRSPLLPTRPVHSVTWYQAMRTLPALGLDLPTEAQWEYAARAGTDTATWFGDENPVETRAEGDANIESPEPDVGSFLPNPFGLHDVLGSCWEWTRESSQADFRMDLPRPGDGLRRSSLGADSRLTRGFRSSKRMIRSPDRGSVNDGVRPARPLWRKGERP